MKLQSWCWIVVLVGATRLAAQNGGAGAGPALSEAEVNRRWSQAVELGKQEKHLEASKLYESILASAERVFGANSDPFATIVNNLGSQYMFLGRYKEAEEKYQHALAIRERTFGKNHELVTRSLGNLGLLYGNMCQFPKAIEYTQRALAIREAQVGRNHLDVAAMLNRIGWLEARSFEFVKAEPILNESLRIREAALGTNHPLVSEPLQNLGLIYNQLGHFDKAEAVYTRCVRIREAAGGKGRSGIADPLGGLAETYANQKRYDLAEPLNRRAIQILETNLGKDHPDVAYFLTNMGYCYAATKQLQKAEDAFRRSLEIREKGLGPNNPVVAATLIVLGHTLIQQGKHSQAMPLFRRSIAIQSASLGEDHPQATTALGELAWCLALDQKWPEAFDLLQKARQRQATHLSNILPSLSEREQLSYLKKDFELDLHDALAIAWNAPKDLASISAEWLLNAKALTLQTLGEQQFLVRDAKDPKTQQIVKQLLQVRAELAGLIHRQPTSGREAEYQKDKQTLKDQEREIAGKLARAAGRVQRGNTWMRLDELRGKLSPQAAFVDIARFNLHDFKANTPLGARYAAWITTAKGESQLIDLGDAEPIDRLVGQLRTQLVASAATVTKVGEAAAFNAMKKSLQDLSAKILTPLYPTLKDREEWIVCPDGALWLLPWNTLLLPDGSFAVEKHLIRHVVSGRDLVVARGQQATPSAVIVADPEYGDGVSALLGKRLTGAIGTWKVSFEFLPTEVLIYDEDDGGTLAGKGTWNHEGDGLTVQTAVSRFDGKITSQEITGQRVKKDQAGAESKDAFRLEGPAVHDSRLRALGGLGIPYVKRLPGTAGEAVAVESRIKDWLGAAPTVLVEAQATETRVKTLPPPRVLVLATHGYFLATQEAEQGTRDDESSALRDKQGRSIENPLLRCGLLFAGCNKRHEAKPGADDGILTGLEIVGMNLQGCELVVLSACETGLGDVRTGEGVAGLRQAFQLAGAGSVLSSLWQVPDRETALLMSDFYGELSKGKSQTEALRTAQVNRITARRNGFGAAHPFFWAAFSLTSR